MRWLVNMFFTVALVVSIIVGLTVTAFAEDGAYTVVFNQPVFLGEKLKLNVGVELTEAEVVRLMQGETLYLSKDRAEHERGEWSWEVPATKIESVVER